MIEAKNVNFEYRHGIPVLNDVSCQIADGDFAALMGENGSGKTTLSRMFMSLSHPHTGTVLVDGQDIAKMEPADLADKVGYVFQNPDLQILEDTVWDEVAYGPRCKKLSEAAVKEQVDAALAAVGLAKEARHYPRSLSFGQKRRLGVATALALNPKTLILDEITNGQDEGENEKMMLYLERLNKEHGTTIILITHDMNIARCYCRRALVLQKGSVVFDGATAELFGGSVDVAGYGLSLPALTQLSVGMGINAASPEDFCAQLVVKGGAEQ